MLKDSDQLKDRGGGSQARAAREVQHAEGRHTCAEAAATRDKLKKKLDEVEDFVKEGWDAAKLKLDQWAQTDD